MPPFRRSIRHSARSNKVPGWLLGGALLIAATAAPARVPYTVVDSRGTVFGPAMDLASDSSDAIVRAAVPFRVGARRIVLNVDRNGYIAERREYTVLFESRDCVGPGYMETPAGALTSPFVISGPRHSLYVADPAFRYVQIASFMVYLDAQGQCHNFGQTYRYAARPLLKVLDLDDRFVPPFRISATTDAVDLGAPGP